MQVYFETKVVGNIFIQSYQSCLTCYMDPPLSVIHWGSVITIYAAIFHSHIPKYIIIFRQFNAYLRVNYNSGFARLVGWYHMWERSCELFRFLAIHNMHRFEWKWSQIVQFDQPSDKTNSLLYPQGHFVVVSAGQRLTLAYIL